MSAFPLPANELSLALLLSHPSRSLQPFIMHPPSRRIQPANLASPNVLDLCWCWCQRKALHDGARNTTDLAVATWSAGDIDAGSCAAWFLDAQGLGFKDEEGGAGVGGVGVGVVRAHFGWQVVGLDRFDLG